MSKSILSFFNLHRQKLNNKAIRFLNTMINPQSFRTISHEDDYCFSHRLKGNKDDFMKELSSFQNWCQNNILIKAGKSDGFDMLLVLGAATNDPKFIFLDAKSDVKSSSSSESGEKTLDCKDSKWIKMKLKDYQQFQTFKEAVGDDISISEKNYLYVYLTTFPVRSQSLNDTNCVIMGKEETQSFFSFMHNAYAWIRATAVDDNTVPNIETPFAV